MASNFAPIWESDRVRGGDMGSTLLQSTFNCKVKSDSVRQPGAPEIAAIVGGSCETGHYAMCGKAFDLRFVFAWPSARSAVMSGSAAAGTLVEFKIKQIQLNGGKLSEEDKRQLSDSVRATYESRPARATARPACGLTGLSIALAATFTKSCSVLERARQP